MTHDTSSPRQRYGVEARGLEPDGRATSYVGLDADHPDYVAYPPDQGYFGLDPVHFPAPPGDLEGRIRDADPLVCRGVENQVGLAFPTDTAHAGADATPVKIALCPSIPPDEATTCDHSTEALRKDNGAWPCVAGPLISVLDPSGTSNQSSPLFLDFDIRPEASFLRASRPARKATRIPPRIADRPQVDEWSGDELLTLPEAASLFWPAGPITTNILRIAVRDGTLTTTKVAGQHFVTLAAIRRMGLQTGGAEEADPYEVPANAALVVKHAEAQKLGGVRAPKPRASKRSIAPATLSGRTEQ
ncbi:hypothetical protein [Methylobacterium pseudosasicola]|nr:hypothetical protein [Methylobacterium pseudosasicola]